MEEAARLLAALRRQALRDPAGVAALLARQTDADLARLARLVAAPGQAWEDTAQQDVAARDTRIGELLQRLGAATPARGTTGRGATRGRGARGTTAARTRPPAPPAGPDAAAAGEARLGPDATGEGGAPPGRTTVVPAAGQGVGRTGAAGTAGLTPPTGPGRAGAGSEATQDAPAGRRAAARGRRRPEGSPPPATAAEPPGPRGDAEDRESGPGPTKAPAASDPADDPQAPGANAAEPPDAAATGDALPLRLADPEDLARLILAPGPATRSEMADPGLTELLEDRLEAATPFALLPWHAALRLFWSALPDGFAERTEATGAAISEGARAAYLAGLAGLAQAADAGPVAGRLALEAAISAILDRAPSESQRRLAARTALARLRFAGAGTPADRALAEAALRRTVPGLDPASAEAADRVITRVAGLVLFAPYLRMLLDRASVLAPDGRIEAHRLGAAAGHLRALSRLEAEGLDPLERILLGLAPGQTAAPAPPDPAMLTLTEGLTQAVIERWGALGRTSAEGLREAFVRREGDLTFDPDGTPRLRVLPGAFDVLLDRLPWSVATLRAPWMPAPLHVRWRDADD